ncbi:MAG: sulfate reduction electron transfer complex DsrMKJOP subunit DsrJ [Acidobacteriota bacterium]
MHDAGKIITGLALFLAAALLPFWHNAAAGKAVKIEPKIVTQEKQCVAAKDTMRANHMDLLNTWRDQVVRQGRRTAVTEGGKQVAMSLSNTCLSCHPNKQDFCDTCHNYLAVAPYCWDCHVAPKERS